MMEDARQEAHKRRRERKDQQRELFDSEVLYKSTRYDDLRNRYLAAARTVIETALAERKTMPYDKAWASSMAFPLVWESDLKNWINEWQSEKKLIVQRAEAWQARGKTRCRPFAEVGLTFRRIGAELI